MDEIEGPGSRTPLVISLKTIIGANQGRIRGAIRLGGVVRPLSEEEEERILPFREIKRNREEGYSVVPKEKT